jgi:lipid-binding SYLF domain-containing protein
VKGKVDGYYNTTSACPGLQAGAQTYSYALFFMTPGDLQDLKKSGGLNLGAAPGLTVADKGVAGGASLYTLQGIKAFVFGQKGLMANIGFKATKISEYTPSN